MTRTRAILVTSSAFAAMLVIACGNVKVTNGPKADGDDKIVAVAPGQNPGADPVETRLKRLNVKVKREGGKVVEARVFNQAATDADLAELATLTDLRRLDLTGVKVTGTGLAALQALPLEELNLSFSGLTDAGLKEVTKFGSLKSLSTMNAGDITDDGVAGLAALKNLESLTVGQNFKVKDVGTAKAVRGMPGLKHLDVTNSSVGDGAMAALPTACPDLRELKLYGSQVTDVGMGSVGKAAKLEELYLSGSISDAGLAKLTGLTNLKLLSLNFVGNITPAGLARLPWLANLKDLDLKGNRNLDATKLRAILPNTNVKP